MIITIAGEGGSGKTTVAKILAKKLHYKHYSTGDLRGEIAQRHGLTIDQLNDIGTRERWTDEECDARVKEIGKNEDNIVFDSWMAWHFIPHSRKIFLTVDQKEAAKRVFKNQRPDEAKQDTIEGVHRMLQDRFQNNIDRYKKWYGVDITNKKNYDVVIDATKLTPEQVVEKILTKLQAT